MKNVSSVRIQRAAALLCMALASAVASTAQAQTAEEVIAKNVKAQGGREALLGLKSLERKGKVSVDGSFGQMEGSVEEISIPWKKALRSLDLGVFMQKEGWNGKAAWRDGQMGVQELDGDEANVIKQAVDLNPFLMIGERDTKAEKLDDEKIDDVDYCVIRLTPKDKPAVKFFIDKTSDMVKRTTVTQNNPQFGKVDVVVENSGYEQFGPVKLATKTNVQLGDILKIETTYTDTKVNGAVDEAIFEAPKDAAK